MDPENGTVTVTNTTFASTATYSCNDGYSLVGVTTRTCLASDLWSGDEPTCRGIVYSYLKAQSSQLTDFLCSRRLWSTR